MALPGYPFLALFPSLQGRRVILCSESPRRSALLSQIGVSHEVVVSGYPELLSGLTPWEYVIQTATEKVLSVYRKVCDDENDAALLIAADTVIMCGSEILEKPKTHAKNLEMLKALRLAGEHKVLTAVAVLVPMEDMPVAPGYVVKTTLSESTVHFDDVSDDLLASYVQTGEGLDKAGGYAIQGQAQVFISRIDGQYDGIVGLPLNAMYKCIKSALEWDVYEEQDN